jgi:hypothetical protein
MTDPYDPMSLRSHVSKTEHHPFKPSHYWIVYLVYILEHALSMSEDIITAILEGTICIVPVHPYTSVRLQTYVNDLARKKVIEPDRTSVRVNKALSCASVHAMDNEDAVTR